MKQSNFIRYLRSILFLVFVFLCCFDVSIGDEVFASAAQIQLLDKEEETLTNALNAYLDWEFWRLHRLQDLLHEVRTGRKKIFSSDNKKSGIMDHPLNVYYMIDRFGSIWNDIRELVLDFNASVEFNTSLAKLEPIQPQQIDFRGSRLALVRLQMTYRLPIEDLLNGIVVGYAAPPLSQQHALAIGLTAIDVGLSNQSLVWLNAALKHHQEPRVRDSEIYHALAKAYAAKDDYMTAVDYVRKAVELDPSNAKYLKDLVADDNWNSDYISTNDLDDFMKICNKLLEQDVLSKSTADDQVCVLERSATVPYQRNKVEYVSRFPDVILYHDFLTDREGSELQEIAMTRMQRAQVGGRGIGRTSDIRVGKIAWLMDRDTNHTIINRISHRIGDFTRLEMKTAEALQMSNYGMGGHYSSHYDPFRGYGNGTWFDLSWLHGDRIATFMIYLSEVKLGGATVFPKIGVGARPVKNAAIFWYNYYHNGTADKNTLHGGCPVLIGEKWVANKWIHEFGQEFRRPCLPTMAAYVA